MKYLYKAYNPSILLYLVLIVFIDIMMFENYFKVIAQDSIVLNPFSKSVQYFNQPSAFWITNYDSLQLLQKLMKISAKKNSYFLLVQYIIPKRDREGFSRGGCPNTDLYIKYVKKISLIINNKPTIMIVEPDELSFDIPQLDLILFAVKEFREKCPLIKIFIDSGHPKWKSIPVIVERLKKAGINYADGISINVSSFNQTISCLEYGNGIVKHFPNKKFIVDTSRNGGRIPTYPDIFDPKGIRVGIKPTFITGNPNCFAFLWVKPPGESDGRVLSPGQFDRNLIEEVKKNDN